MSKFDGLDKFVNKVKKEEEPVVIQEPAKKPATTPAYEKRDKSMNILIKPSTHKALMKLRAENVIKSANDLINDLLEEYLKKNNI